MRLFFVVLLFLVAVIGTSGQDPCDGPSEGCQDKHRDVVKTLLRDYGSWNCIIVYNGPVNLEEGYVKCKVDIDGFYSFARYEFSFWNCETRPDFMSVVKRVKDSDGSIIEEKTSETDFSMMCTAGYVGLFFREVRDLRLAKECPESSTQAITFTKGDVEKSTTCKRVGESKTRTMRRLCRKHQEISDACTRTCKPETFPKCMCENNPYEFPVGKNGATTTCDEFARQSEKKIKRKCQGAKFKSNCPAVCGCQVIL